jgi:uncharacterized protein YkwD
MNAAPELCRLRARPAYRIGASIAIVLAALCASAGLGAQSLGDERDAVDVARVATIIIDETNAFRGENDVAPLERNDALAAAARTFAEYMARTGSYGHTADGKQPAERIAEQGYAYCGIAENIAYAYRSSGFRQQQLGQVLVQGWIDSPPHRKNMLDPSLTEIGVGVAQSAETGYYYAVQDFGRPKSATIEFSVANQSTERVTYSVGDQSFTLPPRATRTHQLCREPMLDFSLPGRRSRSRPMQFKPERGDRFVVTGSKGTLGVARR